MKRFLLLMILLLGGIGIVEATQVQVEAEHNGYILSDDARYQIGEYTYDAEKYPVSHVKNGYRVIKVNGKDKIWTTLYKLVESNENDNTFNDTTLNDEPLIQADATSYSDDKNESIYPTSTSPETIQMRKTGGEFVLLFLSILFVVMGLTGAIIKMEE